MTDLSEAILTHAVDWAAIAERRRNNYRYLQERIGNAALRPTLDESTVPLGFPVRLSNRDQVRSELFRKEIFPPVHWPIDGCVPAEYTQSHTLSAEIMTLPCDQRCNADDLDRIVRTFKTAAI